MSLKRKDSSGNFIDCASLKRKDSDGNFIDCISEKRKDIDGNWVDVWAGKRMKFFSYNSTMTCNVSGGVGTVNLTATSAISAGGGFITTFNVAQGDSVSITFTYTETSYSSEVNLFCRINETQQFIQSGNASNMTKNFTASISGSLKIFMEAYQPGSYNCTLSVSNVTINGQTIPLSET